MIGPKPALFKLNKPAPFFPMDNLDRFEMDPAQYALYSHFYSVHRK